MRYTIRSTMTSLLTACMLSMSPWHVDINAFTQAVDEQGLISPIKKGQPSPFDGVVMNDVAAANITTEKKIAEERCDARVTHDVDIVSAEKQLEVDNLKAANDAYVKRLALEESVNKRQVEAISTELARTQKLAKSARWTPLYYVGGVVTGVVIIVVGAFAVRGVREADL